MPRNNCVVCGKGCLGEYCFKHKPKKGLKSGNIKPKYKIKSREIQEVEKEEIDKMWSLFKLVWKKRGPYSEVSKKYLGPVVKSIYCHHILEKRNYPELRFEEENIILLTFEEHQKVEQDMYFFEEINKRRENLKKVFNIT